METPRKFIIAELSIRKLGSSSVLIILIISIIIIIIIIIISTIISISIIISTDEDPSLRIESSAIINLRGVSTKLNKYIVFTMQTYKKLINLQVVCLGEFPHGQVKLSAIILDGKKIGCTGTHFGIIGFI